MSTNRLNPRLTQRVAASSMPLSTSKANNEYSPRGSDSQSEKSDESGSSGHSGTTTTSSGTDGDGENPLARVTGQLQINPNLHLIHNGKWLPKQYDRGRLKPHCGLWTCCGATDHLSVYCDSLEKRQEYAQTMESLRLQEKTEKEFRETRKAYLQSIVTQSMSNDVERKQIMKESDNQLDMAKLSLASSADHAYHAPMLCSWLTRHYNEELTVLQGLELVLSYLYDPAGEGCRLFHRHGIIIALQKIHGYFFKRSQKVISLVIQIYRQLLDCNFTRDMIVQSYLDQQQQQAIAGEESSQHSGDHSINNNHNNQKALKLGEILFDILQRWHRGDEELLDHGLRCCMQLARYEVYRTQFFHDDDGIDSIGDNSVGNGRRQVLYYLLLWINDHLHNNKQSIIHPNITANTSTSNNHKKNNKKPKKNLLGSYDEIDEAYTSHLQSFFRLLYWSATTAKHCQYLFHHLKIIQFTIKIMKRNLHNALILSAAIPLLHHLASYLPHAMQLILTLQIPSVIIQALKVLPGEESVQLAALKLLHLLAHTSQGWQQINAVRGGWQFISQGTMVGNDLVHALPGPFNNPGWSIGDTPYLSALDEMKLQAAKKASTSLQQLPMGSGKGSWTANSLKEYMGIPNSGQTLEINKEHHQVYFELLVTLDMLPYSEGEIKEQWFRRVRAFEVESEVQIEDMVTTILEMKHRDNLRKKMADQQQQPSNSGGEGAVAVGGGKKKKKGSLNMSEEEIMSSIPEQGKEIYVQGKLITTETLAENDADLGEAMDGLL